MLKCMGQYMWQCMWQYIWGNISGYVYVCRASPSSRPQNWSAPVRTRMWRKSWWLSPRAWDLTIRYRVNNPKVLCRTSCLASLNSVFSWFSTAHSKCLYRVSKSLLTIPDIKLEQVFTNINLVWKCVCEIYTCMLFMSMIVCYFLDTPIL